MSRGAATRGAGVATGRPPTGQPDTSIRIRPRVVRFAAERTSVSITLPAGRDPVAAGRELRGRVGFCDPPN
ncbi:hypothetical protein C2U71_16735 [Burkholderia ubonensis]|nr:hypothetical protein C2U71_16735 [Burkholderia ubonensis]